MFNEICLLPSKWTGFTQIKNYSILTAYYLLQSFTYIAEIQTDEFWTIFVRKYGGDLAKVYSKIRGTFKSFAGRGEVLLKPEELPEVTMNCPGLRP